MYWFLRFLSATLSFCSNETLSRLAAGIAWLCFSLLRIRRSIVLYNLKVAFPEKSDAECKKIAWASYYHFALTILEFLATPAGHLGDDVEIANPEYLSDALKEGRGVYVLCFHMGNWEAMCSAMTKRMVKSHVVVKRIALAGVDRFLDEKRIANGFFPLRKKKKGEGFQLIKDTLAKGQVVGFVMDQARPSSPLLPFFGQPAKTNVSFAAIWQKAKAPVIPSYIERKAAGKHLLHIFPPLELKESGDLEADIMAHSTLFNATIADLIRKNPEQYFWAHRRFK